MADVVQLRLENTLPELEEMKRIELFTTAEIKQIIKKRKSYEYKLLRKEKESFLKCIEFEMNLLTLIKKKRQRLLCDAKKPEIDRSIARRIDKLFRIALSRFSEDEKLWLDHIQFCKRMKWFENVNTQHTQLLQVHSKNPDLWIMVAKWQMEEMNAPETARKLLQRAITINSTSEILWREYFRMEMMYIDLTRKRRAILDPNSLKDFDTDETDAILSGKLPNVVFDMAVDTFDDMEFALSFLNICMEFDFGGRHIDYILDKVQQRFVGEEVLDALAKKPLLNIEERIKECKKKGIKKTAILREARQQIRTEYEAAVRQMPTEKMWSFYIDYALTYMNAAKESKKNELQDSIIDIMERAAEANLLSAKFYSQLVDLLFIRGNADKGLSTALFAARKWNTPDLWACCLTYHIRHMNSHSYVYDLLIEAVGSVVEKDSIELWKLGVMWLSISDDEKLIAFFEKGILQRKEVSEPLKDMYLEASVLRNGIEGARTLYKKFKKIGPLTPHIIKKMIRLEKCQLNTSIENIRKYFEDGINQFGSVNVDIWVDYMELEREQPGGNPVLCAELHWRAKKTLKPDYLEQFQLRAISLITGST